MRDASAKTRFYGLVLDNTSILLNCGLHRFPPTAAHVISSIGSFDELIAVLTDLATVSDLKVCLQLLVVDDLSQFYWELKASSKSRASFVAAYMRLFDCLDALRRKFGCNIVVTAWDKLFESGYNYHGSGTLNGNGYNDVTYLPKEFLLDFDQVYYVFGDAVKRLGPEGWAFV